MRNINKILIISIFSFLLLGAVGAATEKDSLKVPSGFSEFKNGTSTCQNDNKTYELDIDKVNSEETKAFIDEHKDHIHLKKHDNNTYYFRTDDLKTVGLIEKVKIDNEDYFVYITHDGERLTKNELKKDLESLNDFNNANNLKAESGVKKAIK